jgi:DNA-3-methyladenine glycosylase
MNSSGRPFPRSFFLQPTVEVARQLLGALLVRRLRRGRRVVRLVGRIVEVEAYLQGDPACHSVRVLKDGTCVPRPSARNRSMFGPPGRAYVYFTYGMHHAMNVVAQKPGAAEGVLLRAMEPLEGIEVMAELRGVATHRLRQLASGPGKLTQAMAIDLALDGHDLSKRPLMLLQGRRIEPARIGVSGRIGVAKAADRPLRFFEKDSPFVSRKTKS